MEVSRRSPNCGLDEVLATARLDLRPCRSIDPSAENEALVGLTDALARRPADLLDTLVEKILACCNAESAGISILECSAGEPAGSTVAWIFRWHAVAGAFADYAGGTLARRDSPCGVVIDRDQSLLFDRPQRRFVCLRETEPPIGEALLVPFYVDERPLGTVWAVTHDSSRLFDAEDLRLLRRLARFASLGYRIQRDVESREKTNSILRRAYTEQCTRSSRLRQFATELTSSENRARRQFAAELQENLQQMLVAARLQLAGGSGEETPVTRASQIIDEAVDVARRLVTELRPPTLYELGLLPALRSLAEDLRDRQLLEVLVECDEDKLESVALDNDARALLFEGVRELLCNVSKHSGVTRASVSVAVDAHSVAVAVSDPGRGSGIRPSELDSVEGAGLFGIRERLTAVGGHMDIDSAAGRGTRVELRVPLAAAGAHDQVC